MNTQLNVKMPISYLQYSIYNVDICSMKLWNIKEL